ncbi:hypothetical protein B9Z65_1697 [Elsinoe australis]|uniref:Rhodopsin domain-containing protein n=1 Tax=Elsinoe australis TaxID=40998 RepID=A0A2P7Z6Y3_9PEZI|nr:hypothetical protein B9Z65_1697 [Elsinoe australis]
MAATSILCDFIVFLLPLPVLLCRVAGSGSITNNQHLVSAATFACGLLTTVVSIARAVYLREVQNGNGDNTMVVLMGVVEINVGTIMSCLPFFARHVMDKVIKRKHSLTHEIRTEDSLSHDDHQRFLYNKVTFPRAAAVGRDSHEGILEDSDAEPPHLEILRTLSVSQESKKSEPTRSVRQGL